MLKYLPDFLDHFNSLSHAKHFLVEFSYQYNYVRLPGLVDRVGSPEMHSCPA